MTQKCRIVYASDFIGPGKTTLGQQQLLQLIKRGEVDVVYFSVEASLNDMAERYKRYTNDKR